MNDFDKIIIEKMKTIGFSVVRTDYKKLGIYIEYKYYPSYMTDTHYTLGLFDYHNADYADHRLYVHNNSDGSYVASTYQTSSSSQNNATYIDVMLETVFASEILELNRQATLKDIINS